MAGKSNVIVFNAPGPQGPQGKQGPVGPQGPQGAGAVFPSGTDGQVMVTIGSTATFTSLIKVETTHGKFTAGGSGTSEFKIVVGPDTGFETLGGCIWILPAGTDPSATNSAIAGDGANLDFNAISSTGSHAFFTNGTSQLAKFQRYGAAPTQGGLFLGSGAAYSNTDHSNTAVVSDANTYTYLNAPGLFAAAGVTVMDSTFLVYWPGGHNQMIVGGVNSDAPFILDWTTATTPAYQSGDLATQLTVGTTKTGAKLILAGGANVPCVTLDPDGNANIVVGIDTDLQGQVTIDQLASGTTTSNIVVADTTGILGTVLASDTHLPFPNMQEHKVSYWAGWSNANGTLAAGAHYYGFNAGLTTNGTVSNPTSSTAANRLQAVKRVGFNTTTTGLLGVYDATAINAGVAQYGAWRGNAAGRGGFIFRVRFAVTSVGNTSVWNPMIGLTDATGASATDFSATTTIARLGLTQHFTSTTSSTIPGSTNWKIVAAPHSGAPQLIDTGMQVTLNDLIEMIIYCPSANTPQIKVNNLTAGTSFGFSEPNNPPGTTTFLMPWVVAGIASSTSGTNQIDICSIYQELFD